MNPRNQAIDPIAVPKPSSSSSEQQQVPVHRQPICDRYYTGNVQLMEARVMELSSTVRALYRSIQELQIAVDEERSSDDNDTGTDSAGADPVFVEAIEENAVLIERHQKELSELVHAMNESGATSAEVPDDIRVIDVPSIRQQLKQYQKQSQQQHDVNNNSEPSNTSNYDFSSSDRPITSDATADNGLYI
jgi:multidrug resistance efflux pump